MIAKVLSFALQGLDGVLVTVETDISKGLPAYDMVGLPDAAVKEAKERVKSAVKNSGLGFPTRKISVNFAPAYVKKEGTALDLPIAISLLKAEGTLVAEMEDIIFLGELALNGDLRPVRGVLPLLIAAKKQGYKKFILPVGNQGEASHLRDIEAVAAASLKEVQMYLIYL